jgi:hypothetical protein
LKLKHQQGDSEAEDEEDYDDLPCPPPRAPPKSSSPCPTGDETEDREQDLDEQLFQDAYGESSNFFFLIFKCYLF